DNALRLVANPSLAGRLERTVGVPIHWIHVVRNPFDNVATMVNRAGGLDAVTQERTAEGYSALSRALERLLDSLDPACVTTLRHEAFVADPRGSLTQLCGSLGLDAPVDYLDACATVVFDQAR